MKLAEIVPTHVGVNRTEDLLNEASRNCPHARGGEPLGWLRAGTGDGLSPRTWG
ncbi:conserved hypothetical protein [uncultured Desulfobacterium sp.]|uniref:Uncharacterized protein n=1 Tax=uncultured Desulfobacterium sp. TaxID=201089 RepID=A0A445N0X3_9BACT|nr:conserved hypothetical protein [uncultured Desulfobacterium sp.]